MTRQQKEQIVQGLKANMEKASALFYTDMIGIKANDANALRRSLWNTKGQVVVAKNSLLQRAVKGSYAEKTWTNLKGSSAIVFAFEDAAAVAKCFKDMENLPSVALRGGYLREKELDIKQIKTLANLPARPQMLATLLASFMAPASAFVRALEAIRTKKEQESGKGKEISAASVTKEEKIDNNKTENKK